MAEPVCEAKGCTNKAGHYELLEGHWRYLCSDCKLKVRLPYLETPEMKGAKPRGDSGRDKHDGDAVPAVREVVPVDEASDEPADGPA